MKISSSSGKGNFKLTKDKEEICELIYNNWFSGKATTVLKGNKIEIKPKNIWTSSVEIHKNESKIGDITFNLKGQMVIRLSKPDGEEFNYVMKNKAKWTLKFDVFDASNELQFSLNSVNKWTKLNYDYDIEMERENPEFDMEELALYCGYAANLYLAIVSAV
ncbi:aminotransferase [Flagellimonas sp. GZD32]|uniref:aminotransferase n=1 Tax=Flagellimonas cixiensis TaxID=3228750 RepID=UPI0035C939F9